MNTKERLILIELMNHEYMPAQNLAYAIQMSTRSLNSLIKNISVHIRGAHICSGAFGYQLVITEVVSVLLGDIAVQRQILEDPVYDNFVSVVERIEV